MENAKDKIELRSEKVRNIMRTIPPALVTWGTTIIVVILLAMLFVLFFLPFPHGLGETIFQHIFTS